MRPTKASDSAKQAISRFEGVRRRDGPNMAATTKALTATAIGAVMMLMIAVIRFVVNHCET